MKITKKNFPFLVQLVSLSVIIGSVSWGIVAVVFSGFGLNLEAAAGSIGFDIKVISFYLQLNPGTLLGIIAGIAIFLRL